MPFLSGTCEDSCIFKHGESKACGSSICNGFAGLGGIMLGLADLESQGFNGLIRVLVGGKDAMV